MNEETQQYLATLKAWVTARIAYNEKMVEELGNGPNELFQGDGDWNQFLGRMKEDKEFLAIIEKAELELAGT